MADHVCAVTAALDGAAGPVLLVAHSAGSGIAHAAIDQRPVCPEYTVADLKGWIETGQRVVAELGMIYDVSYVDLPWRPVSHRGVVRGWRRWWVRSSAMPTTKPPPAVTVNIE